MKRQFTYPSKQLFINYVIGEPYSSSGLIIVDEDVLASISLPSWKHIRTSDYAFISVGIDWGATNWMIVLGMTHSGRLELLNIYWAEDNPNVPLQPVNIFASYLRAFQPDIIVADAGYGADRNTFLLTQFPKAMYACQWTTIKDSYARSKFVNTWNERSREVMVDKTTVMQRTLHKVKGRLIGVPPMDEKVATYLKHLKNVRIMDMEDSGIVYQVATRIGPDHLGCALTYGLVGVDKLNEYGTAPQFGFDFI
jgi:hypothetical protein